VLAGVANPGTGLNSNFDAFEDGAYDPGIADAVNQLETQSGLYPPASVPNVIAQTFPEYFLNFGELEITEGQAQVTIIGLTKGRVVTNINLNCSSGSEGQTNFWAAITDIGTNTGYTLGTVLAVTGNTRTDIVNSATPLVMPLKRTWEVPYSGLFYIHLLSDATIQTPYFDVSSSISGVRSQQNPFIAGLGDTSYISPPVVGDQMELIQPGFGTGALYILLN
jgi:hypothetical protein